jgi:hypothetical protein
MQGMRSQEPRSLRNVGLKTPKKARFQGAKMQEMRTRKPRALDLWVSRQSRRLVFMPLNSENDLRGNYHPLNFGFYVSPEGAFSGRQNAGNELIRT